jgi:hypothetical protein
VENVKRDPKQQYIDEHISSIRVKKIYPFLFYHQCLKCGMEYIREPMYECSYRDWFFEHTSYHEGCSNCFSSENDFKKWLQDKKILYTEETLAKHYDSPYN